MAPPNGFVARPPMWLMPPARRFSKLCAVRATATGWKSAATSFPKAARCPAPGPRRPEACREIFPAAPAAEIVANVAGAGFTAHLDLRTQGDRQSVTIRPQGGTDVT